MATKDKMKVLPKPCLSCPWIESNDATDIESFDLERAEGLAKTCPDARGMGPDFGATWFACHLGAVGGEFPCAGWLAAVGSTHPHVRMAVTEGRLSLATLTTKPDWPPLHSTFEQVITKLRRTVNG